MINCAAYTNVDGAEGDPDAAGAVNATGPGFLAEAAAAAGAWLVHVSTDYVFDGTKTSPYLESDPTGPRSVYGSTKLLGERAIALAAPQTHTIVRSSWLFGTAGPCFPATMLRLAAEHDTLTVVDDQVGCPTFTGHLAPALVELATRTRAARCHASGGVGRVLLVSVRGGDHARDQHTGRGAALQHRGVPAPGAAAGLQRAALRAA